MFGFRKERKTQEPEKESRGLVIAPDQFDVQKGFVKYRTQYTDGSMSRRSVLIPTAEFWGPIMEVKKAFDAERVAALRGRGYRI